MKPIKKVLILCDAHDCIKYNANNVVILKQLYVLVFLLRKYFIADNQEININNRAAFDFDVFWEPQSEIASYLADSTSRKPWNEIDMLNYDLIICHPEYQLELQTHFSEEYRIENYSKIYTMVELDYDRKDIYPSTGALLSKGGLLELDESQKKDIAQSTFKERLNQSNNDFTRDRQEAGIQDIDALVKDFGRRLEKGNIKNVLVLEPHNKNSYIGDAVIWFANMRKLFDIFPERCNIRLNITHNAAAATLSEIFQKSIPSNITITNSVWKDIPLTEFDLVLCNSDVLSKFHSYIKNSYRNDILVDLLLYTFTIDDKTPFSENPTLDFYTNISRSNFFHKLQQADLKEERNVYNEISLEEEEHKWAEGWLADNGVQKTDKLIAILHGASGFSKVMCEFEQLKLIKRLFSLDPDIKVLLISETDNETKWIQGSLNKKEREKLKLVEAMRLRKVMCILANKQIVITIGPCTGLMHISNNIYSYLLSHKVISRKECPLLLTYTGKQSLVKYYNPHFWWEKTNLVSCCVFMSHTGGKDDAKLVPLNDCPTDSETFLRQSISAYNIKHHDLLNYIAQNFPGVSAKTGIAQFNSECSSPDTPRNSYTRIPTFIINLKERSDRREHMAAQFLRKTEFDYTFVDAIRYDYGNKGLWYTIKKILSENEVFDYEYILLCEDDHEFTEHYSEQLLRSSINNALLLKADILLGGIGGFNGNTKFVHPNMVALDGFACTQFTIIFKSLFNKVLESDFSETDCVDWKMAEISNRKLVIYPFISKQKDFGYSDVSSGYYENKMTEYFNMTSHLIKELRLV